MKEWQKEAAFYWGKHMMRYPADDGVGYQYRPGIIRAIVADGAVGNGPTWERSPQVRPWLDDPKQGLWKRFKAWLDK